MALAVEGFTILSTARMAAQMGAYPGNNGRDEWNGWEHKTEPWPARLSKTYRAEGRREGLTVNRLPFRVASSLPALVVVGALDVGCKREDRHNTDSSWKNRRSMRGEDVDTPEVHLI